LLFFFDETIEKKKLFFIVQGESDNFISNEKKESELPNKTTN